jgi:hypothetical protein
MTSVTPEAIPRALPGPMTDMSNCNFPGPNVREILKDVGHNLPSRM